MPEIAIVSSTDVPDNLASGNEIHEHIKLNRDGRISGSAPRDIQTFRKYISGIQKETVTEKQKQILENVIGNRYCDNLCEIIVSESAGRLQLKGWNTSDETTNKWLRDFYVRGNVRSVSNLCHYSMNGDGNAAASLSYSKESKMVRAHRETWWDGDSGIFVLYTLEDTESIAYAVKEWTVYKGAEPSYYRRIVWFPGEIQRWQSTDREVWTHYIAPSDKGQWPIKWVDKAGNPLPPPVVHFPNYKNGELYGQSELDGGFIGAQDQINDIQYIILACSRLTGYQMYTIAGIKEEKDKVTGEVKAVEIGPGTVLRSTSSDTKFGSLPAGDISQLIKAYEHKLSTTARNARIPLHRIGQGNPPSGEALFRAEGPAINKAERQVEVCTPRWSSFGHRAVQIYNAYGPGGLSEKEFINAIMEEPERRDKLSKSVIVNNLGEKISIQEGLRIMEYPPDQAEKIFKEKIDEAVQTALAVQAAMPQPPPAPGGGGGSGGGGTKPAGGGTKPNKTQTRPVVNG